MERIPPLPRTFVNGVWVPAADVEVKVHEFAWCAQCQRWNRAYREPDGTRVCLDCYEDRNGPLPYKVTESGERVS